MVEVHQLAQLREQLRRRIRFGHRFREQLLALPNHVTDDSHRVGREPVLLLQVADASDQLAGVARPAVEPDDEREVRRVDRLTVLALDANGAAHRRGERVRPRRLAVLHLELRAIRPVRELSSVDRLPERARCGVDARDDDGRRGAESGAEGDVAFHRDVESGIRLFGGGASLSHGGVDVPHCGLDQRRRHVHVGSVAGSTGVLDGEPVEREVVGLHSDVVVIARLRADACSSLDRRGHRGFAVDDGVFTEEVHLPRCATDGHTRTHTPRAYRRCAWACRRRPK